MAQTAVPVTTSYPLVKQVPVFTSNSNIDQSILYQSDNGANGFATGSMLLQGSLTTLGNLATVGTAQASGGFSTIVVSDYVNGAPWYGFGQTNLVLSNNPARGATQVAGFFGLNFQTENGRMVIRGENGNVGVNTATPSEKFEVNGNIKLSGSIKFPDGTTQSTAASGSNGTFFQPSTGYVGIGTTNPLSALTLGGTNTLNPNPGAEIDYVGQSLTFQSLATQSAIGNIKMVQSSGYYLDAGDMVFSTSLGPLSQKMRITAGGNVGIGTKTPAEMLDVNGRVKSMGIVFPDGTVQTTAGIAQTGSPGGFTITPGKVGIATSNPATTLDIGNSVGGLAVAANQNLDPRIPASADLLNAVNGKGQLLVGWNRSAGNAEVDLIATATGSTAGSFEFYRMSGTAGTDTKLLSRLNASGQQLFGDLNLGPDNNGEKIIFPDGSQQSTAWTGTLNGGDYAESVDVTGARGSFEPGDLLVIDPDHPGSFLKSSQPYSTLVGGVYATKPGVTGRRQPRDKPQDGEVPMAMVGIVPTKVSSENGAIKVGDLLVSSSRAGYAMKATDRSLMIGATIGKALAPLTTGEGTIEVLISLQ